MGSRAAAAAQSDRDSGPAQDMTLTLADGTATSRLTGGQLRETLARGLFAALRELDRADISTIFARCPAGGGVGYAVRNRLRKAAGFRIVPEDEL